MKFVLKALIAILLINLCVSINSKSKTHNKSHLKKSQRINSKKTTEMRFVQNSDSSSHDDENPDKNAPDMPDQMPDYLEKELEMMKSEENYGSHFLVGDFEHEKVPENNEYDTIMTNEKQLHSIHYKKNGILDHEIENHDYKEEYDPSE